MSCQRHAHFADRGSTTCDRFVLDPQELPEKLQLENELILTKATQIARQSELVKLQKGVRGLGHFSADAVRGGGTLRASLSGTFLQGRMS